jgi:hypothetical protein
MSYLCQMFYWDKIHDKPEIIEAEDWKEIDQLYNRIVKKEKEIKENLLEANKLKSEFLPLKGKVSKQLEIINNLLIDPKSIEKIEDFDIPFAKGNWENIQKISKIMTKK